MKRVGIICGGFSSEYDISVKSASTIRDHFPKEYQAMLVFLRKDGWWVEDGELHALNTENFTYQKRGESISIDLAIAYIHGDPGENGKVQAFLEMQNMPYVNSGPLASQLSFDKWFCNQFLKGFDIPVAKSMYLRNKNESFDAGQIVQELGLPVFVKPCDSGSSYGIARVNEEKDLNDAIAAAFKEGRTVVIESFLDGTEVTCGVYRGVSGTIALPLTEIVSENEFFDYEAKYEGSSQEITPARISDELTKKVQELSLEIYELLQLRSIARIDFMLVEGIPHVIEVNTTPGFSAESLIPQMIEASGRTITQFWSEILAAELG